MSHTISEAVWIVFGVAVVMAFGDVFVVLALAVAIAAMAVMWWLHRGMPGRIATDDARLAPVTQLPAGSSHHTFARRGHRAA
jgi:hypothetical protein